MDIQLIHEIDIYKNEDYEYIYRSLLGKPKSQFEPTDLNVIQHRSQEDTKSIGHNEPY
tara:strand:+ start:339 stop:512 length:174 start_codon:yes stop_codon:yes gene_type:complete